MADQAGARQGKNKTCRLRGKLTHHFINTLKITKRLVLFSKYDVQITEKLKCGATLRPFGKVWCLRCTPQFTIV